MELNIEKKYCIKKWLWNKKKLHVIVYFRTYFWPWTHHFSSYLEYKVNSVYLKPSSVSHIGFVQWSERNAHAFKELHWLHAIIVEWKFNFPAKYEGSQVNNFTNPPENLLWNQKSLAAGHTWWVKGGKLVPPQWGTCIRPWWFWQMTGCLGITSQCWDRSV